MEPSTYESWSGTQARESLDSPGNHRESSQRTTLVIGRDHNRAHVPGHAENAPTQRMNDRPDDANPDNFSALQMQPTTCPPDVLVTYNSGQDSTPQISSHDPWYSSTSAITYLQEGFHSSVPAVTNMNDSLPDTTSFPHHQHPELRRVDYSHPYRQVTDFVDLNFSYRIPRTTTSITTTVHVSVNVTKQVNPRAQTVYPPQMQQPSSIPMSNGQFPFAASQAIPGPSVPWQHHLQHPPAPSSPAGASISAIGNALESNLVFTTPTPPYPYSDPGVTQNDSGQVWSLPQLPLPTSAQQTFLNTFKEASPTPKASSTGSNTKTTKKRKVKMHTCPICKKEFPRPSGLHTHMNTHNNAKPYPCTYPGCHRMFGVRSNAKRHLRTHGIAPDVLSPPSSSSSSLVTSPSGTKDSAATSAKDTPMRPYVVSFHEPIIVGDPVPRPAQDKQIAAHETGDEESANSPRGSRDGRSTPPTTDPGPSFYKVRWLPLSSTSRTSAAALKNIRGQRVDEDQESNEGSVEGPEGSGEESESEGKGVWQPSYAASHDGSHGEGGGKYEVTDDEGLQE